MPSERKGFDDREIAEDYLETTEQDRNQQKRVLPERPSAHEAGRRYSVQDEPSADDYSVEGEDGSPESS